MAGTLQGYNGKTGRIVSYLGDGTHIDAVVATDADGNPASGPSAAYGSGTREHLTDTLSRQSVGETSARIALPTLGPSREVYVMASDKCFFRTGDATVTAAIGTSHPLATDERFYFRVPPGDTHIAYIRDTADCSITICAVA